VIRVDLHFQVALNDGCDEPCFKVDYPFTGLSKALKQKEHDSFNFGRRYCLATSSHIYHVTAVE
jgi:hypothetical protein